MREAFLAFLGTAATTAAVVYICLRIAAAAPLY